MLLLYNIDAAESCGMHLSDQEALEIFKYRTELQLSKVASKSNSSDQLITIPVKAHIIGTNEGAERYNIESLLTQLKELNETFLPIGFYFHLIPNINVVDNDAYIGDGVKENSEQLLGNLISRFYYYGAINIYYTSNTGLCGMAPFPSWSDRYGGKTGVLMDVSCSKPGGMTLAHELGHHFDLLHTFQGYDSKNSLYSEYVTRIDSLKNCQYAGDGFCDTPADIQDASCPYTGDAKDLRGQYYVPDVSLIMSYHADRCQNKFSEQQIQHMREVVQNDTSRTVYLENQLSDFSGVDATNLSLPLNNAEAEYDTPTQFEWESVEGADAYVFSIVTGSGTRERPIYQTVVINDNSHEYSFPVEYRGRTIRWKVTAFKWTQPDALVSQSRLIKVVNKVPTGIAVRDYFSFSTYPNPVQAGGSINVSLADVGKLNSQQNVSIQLIALNGQLVQEQQLQLSSNQLSFSLNDQVQAGIYFMSFQLGDKSFRTKIIVQ